MRPRRRNEDGDKKQKQMVEAKEQEQVVGTKEKNRRLRPGSWNTRMETKELEQGVGG